MTSKTAVCCGINEKMQVFVLLRNVDLAVLSNPDVAEQVRCE